MMDYCTQNATEAQFNQMLLDAGLGVDDGEGNVIPASYEVLVDRIGPITKGDVTYPEYYANIRLLFAPSDEQIAILAPFSIDPSQPQYRTWL